MRTHPYAEDAYRVVHLPGGAFGVEVKIPDSQPAMVTSFETEEAAEAWIARNKQRVIEQSKRPSPFRRSLRDAPPCGGAGKPPSILPRA